MTFIRHERRSEIASGTHITEAPDLIIEILSPGSGNEQRDRIAKRQLYGKYGVLEYWIADLENRTIEIYRLGDQVLELISTFREQDEFTSWVLPGFRCKVMSIFES
jgi:Uma2 family endonuclease